MNQNLGPITDRIFEAFQHDAPNLGVSVAGMMISRTIIDWMANFIAADQKELIEWMIEVFSTADRSHILQIQQQAEQITAYEGRIDEQGALIMRQQKLIKELQQFRQMTLLALKELESSNAWAVADANKLIEP